MPLARQHVEHVQQHTLRIREPASATSASGRGIGRQVLNQHRQTPEVLSPVHVPKVDAPKREIGLDCALVVYEEAGEAEEFPLL